MRIASKKKCTATNMAFDLKRLFLNLKVLGKVEEGDKLLTYGNDLLIDTHTGWVQRIYRYWNNEGRFVTIKCINNLINGTQQCINILKSTDAELDFTSMSMTRQDFLKSLYADLLQASYGIKKLYITYGDDQVIKSRFEFIIETTNRQLETIESMLNTEFNITINENGEPLFSIPPHDD
uniref:Uncharacterized protein n=1 Tax=Megaviridae environmental sample TaxID=1737588 RepID=A0A5J6VJQ4_9VIRU|nr:MAG: hypothetical protein [Megaviridae environmental sample]